MDDFPPSNLKTSLHFKRTKEQLFTMIYLEGFENENTYRIT